MFEHSPGSAHGDTQILHSLVLLLGLSKAADSSWSKVGNMSYVKKKLQDLIHSRNKVEVMIINWPLTGSFDFKYHPWVPQAPPSHWTHGVIITLLPWHSQGFLRWFYFCLFFIVSQWVLQTVYWKVLGYFTMIFHICVTRFHHYVETMSRCCFDVISPYLLSLSINVYPPYPKDRRILWFHVEAASAAHSNHVNAYLKIPLIIFSQIWNIGSDSGLTWLTFQGHRSKSISQYPKERLF